MTRKSKNKKLKVNRRSVRELSHKSLSGVAGGVYAEFQLDQNGDPGDPGATVINAGPIDDPPDSGALCVGDGLTPAHMLTGRC